MASIVSICNLALSNLGKDNISALTDAGAEARACNQFYDQTRDALLQGYPWRFAGKTASLAEVTNDKPGAWKYAYRYPTDCLKVRYLRPAYVENDPTDYSAAQADSFGFAHEIEGQTIYCDLSPAFLRYTFRNVDPTKYPPLFIEALSWHLAVRFAMPLTRDPKMRADAFQLAQQTQGLAQMADANETRETSDHDSEFATERA
ncbi:MAG: hypothetical protein EOQ34_19885 [Mesorhizobium sp.]|nr:hypothetical protein [Mesorhizobium sp.]RWF70085.1 MAG: hypothetical protein EOQ34_19885 [Mesorhizobium sp.]